MSLIREKFTSFLQALGHKNKKTLKKINHIASFFVFTAILPVAYLPIMATGVTEANSVTPAMKLNTNTSELVLPAKSIASIVPGESLEQKAIREQAEAQVKAQAIAAANAKKVALAQSRNTVTRERRVYNDPSDFDVIYQKAGVQFGVDPLILKAIHTVETGASGSTSRANASGAQGPMQFLPSTWRHHAVDGNNDGVTDINNVEDAIFTAAAYLRDCGYPDVRKALWGYNPSFSYYNRVINIAEGFGYGS